jgi:hypothetical protein
MVGPGGRTLQEGDALHLEVLVAALDEPPGEVEARLTEVDQQQARASVLPGPMLLPNVAREEEVGSAP